MKTKHLVKFLAVAAVVALGIAGCEPVNNTSANNEARGPAVSPVAGDLPESRPNEESVVKDSPISLDLDSWEFAEDIQLETVAVPESLKSLTDVAYKLTLQPGQSLTKIDATPITAGETATASIYIWADEQTVPEGGPLIFQLARHGSTPSEHVNVRPEAIETEPTPVTARVVFQKAHDQLRVVLGNNSTEAITLYLAAPSLMRD
jgi:hypothetical protein